MSRDTSLGVALKALLTGQDRVSELDSPKGWKSLNGAAVDIVVLDLPADVRQAALDTLAKRFTGPLVVLLDPAEQLGELSGRQPYAVLRRPFGMSELWSLLVAPSSQTTRAVGRAAPAAPPAPAARGSAPSAGGGTPSASGTAPAPGGGAPVADEAARSEGGVVPAASRPAPSEGGVVPAASRPVPSGGGVVPAPGGGVAPAAREAASSARGGTPSAGGAAPSAGGAARPAAAPGGPAAAPERRSPAAEGRPPPRAPRTPEGSGSPAPSPDPTVARAPTGPRERKAPERRGPSGTETFPAVDPREAAGRPPSGDSNEPAWRWRRRRFQQPRKPPPSGELTEPMPPVEANGRAPEAEQEQTPDTDSAMWHAIQEAPQAVATRLAERLRADVVALMLDNGEGALETAGGVGLTAAERRLQVEYGHDILVEVFRVGVGLIGDTGRVRGIINGIPFGRADTLIMVPLAYEGHGFGVLLAGRHRSQPGDPQGEFTELEIEALMDFGEDVAPALRSAVLLRRLKGQLDLAEGL
jgi:hypothetical protein